MCLVSGRHFYKATVNEKGGTVLDHEELLVRMQGTISKRQENFVS